MWKLKFFYLSLFLIISLSLVTNIKADCNWNRGCSGNFDCPSCQDPNNYCCGSSVCNDFYSGTCESGFCDYQIHPSTPHWSCSYACSGGGCISPPPPLPAPPPPTNYCAAAGYYACTPGSPVGSCSLNGQTCTLYSTYQCNFNGQNYCNNSTCGAPCSGGTGPNPPQPPPPPPSGPPPPPPPPLPPGPLPPPPSSCSGVGPPPNSCSDSHFTTCDGTACQQCTVGNFDCGTFVFLANNGYTTVTSQYNNHCVPGGGTYDPTSCAVAASHCSSCNPDKPPIGYFDGLSCSGGKGWSCDPDTAGSNNVKIYYDAIDSNHLINTVTANQSRPDLTQANTGCADNTTNHAYSFNTPDSLHDGLSHTYYAVGVDINTSSTATLTYDGPGGTTINCAAPLPSVTTSPASGITCNAATLNGSANPSGSSTTGRFRYSTTSPGSTCNDTFGTRVPASGGSDLGSGTSSTAYSQTIVPSANTTYYYCALASNTGGTGVGSVLQFTTPSCISPWIQTTGGDVHSNE